MGNEPAEGDLALEELMLRFRSTLAPEAMERIVGRLARPALAAATRTLGDPSLAEDAVQESFLRVVRHARFYDPRRSFTHWFYAILRNVCRDFQRIEARRATVERKKPTSLRIASSPAAAEDLLQPLPREERLVLLLRLQGGLSFEEIGVLLGISREASKKRAQRGLRRLRERLAVPSNLLRSY